jgi:DNA-3-methyladenine glycosylase
MREFFAAPSTEVAPLLLGAQLTHAGVRLRITEVEAYLGEVDPGSHSFRGPTRRNATMFGPPGHLYVYFTYGMHVCANIVCSPDGVATAVLLRAGEVVDGLPEARMRRRTSATDADLARGPARLTQAMAIPLSDDGVDLLEHPEYSLELGDPVLDVATGPRTGVSGDGGSAAYPWRFWIPGDPTVSPYRKAVRRAAAAAPEAPA